MEAFPGEHIQSRLSDLPPELRNRIYELVVHHEEGGGVISPIRTSPSTNTVPRETNMIILRAGQRFFISNIAYEHKMPSCRYAERGKFTWDDLPEHRKQHLCTLRCLCQPALTQVSRQIRQESLPVFYGQNKFHIEFSNFDHVSIQTPFHWWRAIGNVNLRLIHRLNIWNTSLFYSRAHGVMIRYRHVKDGGWSIVKSAEQIYNTPGLDRSQRIRQAQFVKKIRELESTLSVVKVGGLQVQARDRMAALIRPDEFNYER